MKTKCEHKTGITEYDDSPYRITRCEWGCDQYLAEYTADGLTYIIGEYATMQAAHDAIRQHRGTAGADSANGG